MSVSPGSGSGTPRQWRKHQSAHFVFWFMPGSGAEKNVAALAARLENVRTVTLETLDLEVLTDEQVQVYLLDGMLDGRRPEGGGVTRRVAGRRWASTCRTRPMGRRSSPSWSCC